MTKYDVIIIGAGGAGLMTARTLGRMKYKTLLIDRKDDLLDLSFKTLGSFIDLKQFDLTDEVVAQPIHQAVIYSRTFTKKITGKAYILDKELLHKELINSLDPTYVDIRTSVYIKDYTRDETGKICSISDAKGNQFEADIFVDATGLQGILSKKAGLQKAKTRVATGVEYNVRYLGNPNEIHVFIGKEYQGGYGWIFPLKNERAIVGFGTFDDLVVKELKNRLDQMLLSPKIAPLIEKDSNKTEGGSLPLTEVLTTFVDQNLVCVGDSVSQVNPIFGEGYKFIFESALMAAKAIDKALKSNNLSELRTYEAEWNARFHANYRFAKMAQDKIFKFSKNDLLIDLAILYLKMKKDEKVLKVLAGEYARK